LSIALPSWSSASGVGCSCAQLAITTIPPKIPGLARSGSSVLMGSPPAPTNL
jgi:hypothetical protein